MAQRWLRAGASAVVVTHGPDGAACYTPAGLVHGSSAPVEVVDTVGAGDAFMAGLLDGLADAAALSPDGFEALLQTPDKAGPILDAACAHAAATCARPGADPPWRIG